MIGQDWSVSTLAQNAGVAALQEDAYMQEALEIIDVERKYLHTALERFSFRVYASSANFLLFYSRHKFDLGEKLRQKGIIIRDCSNYLNLTKGYYRIAVKKREENRKLIKAIKDVRKEEFIVGNR